MYWFSTVAISCFLLISAYTYFFNDNTIQGLKELGFPDFFRIQLGVLKIFAAIILLTPQFPLFAKEWAYAGVGFFLITALVAHIAHRDSILISLLLIFLFLILILSRFSM